MDCLVPQLSSLSTLSVRHMQAGRCMEGLCLSLLHCSDSDPHNNVYDVAIEDKLYRWNSSVNSLRCPDAACLYRHGCVHGMYLCTAQPLCLRLVLVQPFTGVSMASMEAATPGAAAAVPLEEDASMAPSGASPGASGSTSEGGGPRVRAAVGRARGVKKPQIDIDDEIVEANKLAELFKKMQKASKVAARNAGRQRQRLVRKAQKLSEQDLMRLAVIKRCGLFVPDDSVLPAAAAGSAGAPPPAKKSKAQEALSNRFKTLVNGAAGAAELVQAMNLGTEGNATASALPNGSIVSGQSVLPLVRCRAPILQRLPARRPHTSATSVTAAAASEVEAGDHEPAHESGAEDGDGDGEE